MAKADEVEFILKQLGKKGIDVEQFQMPNLGRGIAYFYRAREYRLLSKEQESD